MKFDLPFFFLVLLVPLRNCLLVFALQMELSVASWNLCGLGKLVRWPDAASWLSNHDVILVQESLQLTQTYQFNDVTRIDFPAIETARRARGGLVIALRNHKFGATRVTTIFSEEFLLAVHVEIPSSKASIVIMNIYAPVFSTGHSSNVIATIHQHINLIVEQFPSSAFIIAG
jgi:exonuclease III